MKPTFSPIGDQGISITFGHTISLETHAKVKACYYHLIEDQLENIIEVVPSYHSVAVYFDWRVITYETMKSKLEEKLQQVPKTVPSANKRVVLPVCYEKVLAPDLARVAKTNYLSEQDVIKKHTNVVYTVYMIGFLPGFPYVGGLDETIATERLEEPRGNVEAGSVGIAGSQTGVYPIDSPGGWNIIGKTPINLFQANAEQPSLFSIGDQLQFQAVSLTDFHMIESKVKSGVYQLKTEEVR
ncbi:5-oxoprolinase subunit PxpB [Halalkalibacillus halophilus]|uniref:5-oxoprolinase subunit PxpB n=1 Tax=Halalkalibacillus halophilus TaxID=392827 RepID=UPI00041B9936|nr:5-oxoprolinase subunit PxpB [Halalkalibacillus halophilus]